MTLPDNLLSTLATKIKQWATELGFTGVGIAKPAVGMHALYLKRWLQKGYHADMHYMARHGNKRTDPTLLVPDTLSVIMVRLDYLAEHVELTEAISQTSQAYIARYALGKDYHKLMRKKLQQLAAITQAEINDLGFRAFVDSAPVLERALAEQAGLGWIGKNAMLIHPKQGSFFFLGALYTNLALPADTPTAETHCGSCHACLDVCPTRAIVASKQIDSARCISYLTIENKGPIPLELRPLIGNRIFGCDDCQLICPWNKFAKLTREPGFAKLQQWQTLELVTLFNWSETEYLANTAGTVLRRPGYTGWLRNLAVALGNGPWSEQAIASLQQRQYDENDIVREHVQWALAQLK